MTVETYPAPKGYSDLRVAQFGMQFSDTTRQIKADALKVFDQNFDWITGTEGFGANSRSALTAAAKEFDFDLWVPKGQDCWVAVSKHLGMSFEHYQSGTILDGIKGQYTDKRIVSTEFQTRNLGRIHVSAGHGLLKGRPSGVVNRKINQKVNLAKNKKYMTAIANYGAKVGGGSSLFFYGGDQNIVDKVDDTFFGGPLTSCWDELKKWPNTGHGNIDVIASYDRDARVKCIAATAYDDKKFYLNTDHYLVVARYRIKHLR